MLWILGSISLQEIELQQLTQHHHELMVEMNSDNVLSGNQERHQHALCTSAGTNFRIPDVPTERSRLLFVTNKDVAHEDDLRCIRPRKDVVWH